MKLATFNIHGWRTMASARGQDSVGGSDSSEMRPNLDLITNVLTEIDADIIGLNEVFYPRVISSEQETDNRPALEVLASRLGMHYVFGPCLRWPAQNNMPPDAYGNAILSRWPIIASAAHHLVARNEREKVLLDPKEQRGMLEARVLLPSKQTFTVYSTHLDHTDEEVRAIQLRALRTWTIRDRNRPHVVMGDFNAISPWDFVDRPGAYEEIANHPKAHHMANGEKGPLVIPQMEKAGYVDCFTSFGQAGQDSFIPAENPIRIDYIFASKPLADSIHSCEIWQEPAGQEASDHRPVVAEILDGILGFPIDINDNT
ncbi:MAG: endonuclease/exonuclease/phosphatase family protein [Chloroflexota bacterium]